MIINIFKNRQIHLIILLLCVFILNVSLEYSRYLDFIDNKIFETKVEVSNVYKKPKYNILKLKSANFDFFSEFETSIEDEEIEKLDILNVIILTKNVSFLDYIKGFYTKTIYFERLQKEAIFKDDILKKIKSNHSDEMIIELFNTLFLAIPVSKELRAIFTNYSISHVVALSGFHLVVLSFIIYWIFYFPYSFIHQKYFPYRNKRFDILLLTIFILFNYLLLTNIVPSLLRAFTLFCLGIFLLRSNIKLFSFMTLLFTFLIVIAFFPKYLFSIGFWFSTLAVFYIYLFIQYFKEINKWILFLFFNIWMFLIFNPIVHYFFYETAIQQFYSIPITIFFTLFYPFEIFAHIFGFSIYIDKYIKIFLDYKFDVYMIKTPLWFLVIFVINSFVAIFSKKAFITLNVLMIIFNLYLYMMIL